MKKSIPLRFLSVSLVLALCLALFLSFLLVEYHRSDVPPSESDGAPSDGANDSQQAAYEAIIAGLQRELADLRLSQDARNAAYEERIAELENRISVLTDQNGVTDGDLSSSSSVAFTYELRDGYAWITGARKSGTVLEIPQTVNGIAVVGIAEGAFRNTAVEQVVLPDGLQTVDWFAFSGCYKLRSVTIPASVASIGYGAFELCSTSLRFTCPPDSYAAQYAQSYGIAVG